MVLLKTSKLQLRKASLYILLVALIIIPFVLWENDIQNWVSLAIELSSTSGIAVIIFALLSLDIYLPVPSSLVSLAAGRLLPPLTGFLVCFFAMNLGCWMGYYTGSMAGNVGLSKWLNPDQITTSTHSSRCNAILSLIACRGVPILAEVSVLSAGVAQMNKGQFLIATSIANAIIATTYVWIGHKIQHSQSEYFLVVGAMMLPLIFSGVRYLTLKRNQNV